MLCGMLLDNKIIKINNIINKVLLAGDTFMPKMHLRQPQFVYSACGPFTRHKERIKKFKQTGDTRYIYRNDLHKACFQHDSAYADNKDFINRTKADKLLKDTAYNIASNPEYDGYQRGLASMVYKFFDKKFTGSGTAKILDVNEGVGGALFYPYNVLVNKCSGSCNTLDDPMAKMCVPYIVKTVNMKVYNFLMRLNETRNVLWQESCKCVCRLNSSVCNSKQIWNSDTCRCDCKEDFAGIMTCNKGYMWNPSTCACECDMWCKQGQYLNYKKCACKNKLICRVIAECTDVISETMMNNKNNIANDNTTTNIFIGLFSVVMFIGIACLCVFAYFKFIKGKKLLKKNIY